MATLPRDFLAGPLGLLATPVPVVSVARLSRNLERASEIAAANRLALRPHAKTHKCPAIARRQFLAGAAGLTTAKPGEAEVFLAAGAASVTLAYPLVDPSRVERLCRTAVEHGAELKCIADSATGATVLEIGARRLGTVLPVFIKIDVGLHRCGLAPDHPDLTVLAARIARSPHLSLAGLISHAGHAYGARDKAEAARIAEEERLLLLRARDRLVAAGIEPPILSVGSTPTVFAAERFDGLDEIRPGNYVFMDRKQRDLGICDDDDVALLVLATVVCVNDEYAIVDAGSKTLSSDAGAHGTAGPGGFGLAVRLGEATDFGEPFVVARLSEEHGFVLREGQPFTVGERLLILPNHACPVANLAEYLAALHPGGRIEYWDVAARAKVR